MKKIDEIRKAFNIRFYPLPCSPKILDDIGILLSALDERDAENKALTIENIQWRNVSQNKDVRIRELEEEVKRLKEFPQKLRELAKALAPDEGEKTGMVDSGAPDPQGKFIEISAPVCGTCDGSKMIWPDSDISIGKTEGWEPCPDCSKGGG